jgi:PAS domain S-box-containing protein
MLTRSRLTFAYAAQSAALAAVYCGAAVLGLRYASIGQSISLVWPPTGIAIAALTLLGYRYWPSIAVGAFLANAATPVPLLTAAMIALGNTLGALVAAHLLRRVAGCRPRLDDIRHVRALALLAAPTGALTSAILGSASLWLTGVIQGHGLPNAVAVWWTGDLLGALIVAPLLFAWAMSPDSRQSTRRLAEVLLLCVGTVLAVEVGLGRSLNYPYLLFPFVIWAALRFGARGASVMTFIVAAVAVAHTAAGGGPFVSATATRTLFETAGYLGAVSVTGLVLAAAVRMERDQATVALAHSEERLRRALDAAHMGVWVWSAETNTLIWDDNLRRLYGVDSKERIASYEDFLARVHPDDKELVGATVRKALDEGGDLDYEFRTVLPDGRLRWIADHGEIQRNEQGRPISPTGICTDVTDRKVAEERVRQAHRMESIGRLAGGVAHETNNQMSVVLGSADFILRRTDVPEPVRADVEFIRKAAERTAAVTAQLLAFSRRQILKPELLDLNAVVRNWEPVLRRIMGADCGVVLRLAADLGTVRADPGQLEQVLLNLALNARDAMPRGGTISVETFLADMTADSARAKQGTSIQPGAYAVLAVSDTGHGMDKETLSHVFEPFFTTKGVGRGTGLGLSTVYGIVKQSGGYIWVYSEPGQGTTFKIYLPVRTGVVAGERKSSSSPSARRGECVLVVEDDVPVRSIMKRTLEDAGYRVLETGSAAEALEIVGQNNRTISLILTDVIMPGQSGRELADRIATLSPRIPVLFISGYTDGDIERRGLLRPGAAFLQKPVTPDALVRAVQRQLEAPQNFNSLRASLPDEIDAAPDGIQG